MATGLRVDFAASSDARQRQARAECRRFLLRILDLLIASLSLVIVAIPLALLAVACRHSTGASGFFKQARLGKNGKPFDLIKLRTMSPEMPSHAGTHHQAKEATRLGGVLRRAKLDELPQLWNVFKGDMAIVGPRPIVPEEYSDRSHYQRLEVLPGVTGLWQISKARNELFDESPEYDLFYLANHSFGLDLWLIWRTALFLLFRKETELEMAARIVERASQILMLFREPSGSFRPRLVALTASSSKPAGSVELPYRRGPMHLGADAPKKATSPQP
jgi:lipopolysaccharide/colanic/teichoic acid biosynthesis glycosyltransferase